MSNAYSEIKDLYGFSEHYGRKTTVYYLPTPRSRKWRIAVSFASFNAKHEKYVSDLKQENGWHAIKIESYKNERPDLTYTCPSCGTKNNIHPKQCENYGCVAPYWHKDYWSK